MTTWNDTTTSETGWAANEAVTTSWGDDGSLATGWQADANSVQRQVLYNAEVGYNVDYLTYNGVYIQNEIDWNKQSVLETAWAE